MKFATVQAFLAVLINLRNVTDILGRPYHYNNERYLKTWLRLPRAEPHRFLSVYSSTPLSRPRSVLNEKATAFPARFIDHKRKLNNKRNEHTHSYARIVPRSIDVDQLRFMETTAGFSEWRHYELTISILAVLFLLMLLTAMMLLQGLCCSCVRTESGYKCRFRVCMEDILEGWFYSGFKKMLRNIVCCHVGLEQNFDNEEYIIVRLGGESQYEPHQGYIKGKKRSKYKSQTVKTKYAKSRSQIAASMATTVAPYDGKSALRHTRYPQAQGVTSSSRVKPSSSSRSALTSASTDKGTKSSRSTTSVRSAEPVHHDPHTKKREQKAVLSTTSTDPVPTVKKAHKREEPGHGRNTPSRTSLKAKKEMAKGTGKQLSKGHGKRGAAKGAGQHKPKVK